MKQKVIFFFFLVFLKYLHCVWNLKREKAYKEKDTGTTMNVNGICGIRASSGDTLTFLTNVLRGKAGGAYISVDFGEAKRSLNIWIWAGLVGGDPGAVESTAILKSAASTALWFQGFNLG